jgi:hypothetical protein
MQPETATLQQRFGYGPLDLPEIDRKQRVPCIRSEGLRELVPIRLQHRHANRRVERTLSRVLVMGEHLWKLMVHYL